MKNNPRFINLKIFIMNNFATLPHEIVDNSILKLEHVLVYLMCKKYMNSQTRLSFPSITTLVKECGMGRSKITRIINDLETTGFIQVHRAKIKGQSNNYYFPPEKEENFEMVSMSLINAKEFSPIEKGYFAALQKFYFIDKDTRTGKYCLTNNQIAELTGLSNASISRLEKNLIDKDVVARFKTNVKDQITGLYKNERLTDLDKSKQADVLLAEDLNSVKLMMAAMYKEMRSTMSKMNKRLEQIESNQKQLPTSFDFESKESD